MAGKGKLIVIEGGDGSGKATQAKLLLNYLKKEKIPSVHISFPRYKSHWGKIIEKYLTGGFGDPTKLDPYFSAMLYANDRLAFKDELEKLLMAGKIVVCDRYVPSNIGHQAVKIKSLESRVKFIEWLEDFEYGYMGIPKEDVVVYLSVPAGVSQKLMKGRVKDKHESSVSYSGEVVKVYEDLAKVRKHWVRVDCAPGGKIEKPQEIHEEIVDVLRKRNVV